MLANPYTYIGEVVVSVNPYKSLNIYKDSDIEVTYTILLTTRYLLILLLQEYKGREQWERQPHLFSLADAGKELELEK